MDRFLSDFLTCFLHLFFTLFLKALRIRLRIKTLFVYNDFTMKKVHLILLLAPLLFTPLVGCSNSKDRLTYGTYISQSIDELKAIKTSELYERAVNNETFLLAVYQKSYSDDCLCWSTYQNVIVSYMNKYHEQVYLYDSESQDESVKELGIEKANDSTPSLYIFKGKKKLVKYSYNNNKDKELFADVDVLSNKVHKFINKPNMYYVDDTSLKEKLANNEKSVVAFVRKGCGDCKYIIPNVVIPYINKHNTSKDLLVFDMQDIYELSKNETASEEEKALYQNTKDYYGLSETSNEEFGYRKGVVPTIQYYEGNVVKDTTVFFNDSVSQKEDGTFYISQSFYTKERLPNLSYLKDKKITNVLCNKTIDEKNAMQTKSGGYYWSQTDAAKYHTPILEAFLDYYLL